MKRLAFVAVFIVLFSVGLSTTVQAQVSQWKSQWEYAFDYYVTPAEIPCLTETVHVFGSFQNTMVANVTESGQSHFSWNQYLFKQDAVGIDPNTLLLTGTKYKSIGPFHLTINGTFPPDSPIDFTFRNLNHFVGEGTNFFSREIWHVTYERNTNTAKVEFDRQGGFCK